MTEITEGASALSTYGLYAIASALTVCVIYLYKRTVALEKEFRTYITESSKKTSDLQKGLLEQITNALNASVKAIEDSTEVIKRNNEIMGATNEILGKRSR